MPLSDSIDLTPELLRSQATSLRALARRLLRDSAAADDVVQDAWLVALKQAPGPEDAARGEGFLRGVVRNLALKRMRGEARRARREANGARAEGVDGPSEELGAEERARVLRGVTDAVLSLDEPYRTSVLLRFFEDLPPREIARRQGVPVSTVKSRLTRAFQRLRASLSRDYEGDDAAWRRSLAIVFGGPVGVLPLGPGPETAPRSPLADAFSDTAAKAVSAGSTTALPLAFLAMKAKLVLAGTAALAAGIVWWSDSPDRESARDEPVRTTRASEREALRANGFGFGASSDDPDARVAVPATEEVASEDADDAWRAAALPTLPHVLELSGVALHPDGSPVDGARIYLAPRGHVINSVARTDELGRFAVRWRSSTPAQDVAFGIVGDNQSLAEVQELRVKAGGPNHLRIEVPAQERWAATLVRSYSTGFSAGTQGGGEPVVAGSFAIVQAANSAADPAHAPTALLDPQGFTRFVGLDAESGCPATGASGALPLATFKSIGTALSVLQQNDGGLDVPRALDAWTNPASATDAATLFTLQGKVVDARGRAVEDATVLLVAPDGRRIESTRTDAEGRYTLEHAFASDECIARAWAPSLGVAEARFLNPGGLSTRFDAQLDPGLEIRGRIVDGDGVPKGKCTVEAVGRGPERTTEARTTSDDNGFFTLTNCDPVETTLFVRVSGDVGSIPDLVVQGLWPRAYRPEPSADTFEELRVQVREHGSIAFSVVTPSGVPEPRAIARVWHVESGRGAWFPARDEHGRATLGDLPEGTYRIEVGSAVRGWIEVDSVWLAAGETIDLGAIPLRSPSMLALTSDAEDATGDADVDAFDGLSLEIWSTQAGVQSRVRDLVLANRSQRVGAPSVLLPSGPSLVLARRGETSGAIALDLLPAREFALGIAVPREPGAAGSKRGAGALGLRPESPATNGFPARLAAELERAGADRASCGNCHANASQPWAEPE